MKRNLTALLLALCLLLGLAVPALAAANNTYFYNQLSADGKDAYSYLRADSAGLHAGFVQIPKSQMSRAQIEVCQNAAIDALDAYTRDHPEAFWLGESWRVSWEGTYGAGVLTLNPGIGMSWANGARSIADDEAYIDAQADALAAAAKEAGPRFYDQLLYVHDYLTHANRYNAAAAALGGPVSDSTPWEAISALDPTLSPVCEGYARAFKLVCDRLGIPCVLVCGGNHMWNSVQMEDGQWYAVDVTYDDPVYTVNGVVQDGLVSGGETREFFLAGRESLPEHQTDSDWAYPVLSARSYEPSAAGAVNAVPSAWAQAEIAAAGKAGLMPDTLPSGFQQPITRLEFARLAVRLVELAAPGRGVDPIGALGPSRVDPFTDTDDADALTAYALNIIKGKTKSSFDPDGAITRQDAATMLARAARALGCYENTSGKNFADADEISPYARESVAYVSSLTDPVTGSRVMGGVGRGCFDPGGTYTLEQAIVTVYRLYQAL